MPRILAVIGLGLLLAGCVYAGPGYGYYAPGYYRGAPATERGLPGGAFGG